MANDSMFDTAKEPTGESAEVSVGVEQCVLEALDKYVRDEGLTRSEAVRIILADWLRTHGYKINPNVKPKGRATDAVATMEAAIQAHKASRIRKPRA